MKVLNDCFLKVIYISNFNDLGKEGVYWKVFFWLVCYLISVVWIVERVALLG
jgi:hypothetical protein